MYVNYHSLFFTLGAIVGLILYVSLNRKESKVILVADYFWSFLVGLIGARIAYVLFNGAENILDYISFWQSGLISFGGIIFGLLIFYWRRRRAENLPTLLDTFSLTAVLAWSIGRVGNYLNRDAYGVGNDQFLSFYNRVPIQLMESLALLVIFFIVLKMYQRKAYQGQLLWVILIFYGLARFVIDFYRSLPDMFLSLNISQLVALSFAICGIIVISYGKRKKKHTSYR